MKLSAVTTRDWAFNSAVMLTPLKSIRRDEVIAAVPRTFPGAAGLSSGGFGCWAGRASSGARHFFECLIKGERRSLLRRWKLFERIQKRLYQRHPQAHLRNVIDEPVVIRIRSDVSTLERISTQVE